MKWTSYLVLALVLFAVTVVEGIVLAHKYWFPKELVAIEAQLMPAVLLVGTPVSGVVHTVSVREGYDVQKGDILFVVAQQSPLQPHGGNLVVVSAHRDGIITGIAAEAGSFVQASQTLAQIVDRSQSALYVDASVPLSLDDLALLQPPHGATVRARFLNDGKDIAAVVTSVSPLYDGDRGAVNVRLQLLDPMKSSIPIVVGMPVSVSLSIENVNRFKDTTMRLVSRLGRFVEKSSCALLFEREGKVTAVAYRFNQEPTDG